MMYHYCRLLVASIVCSASIFDAVRGAFLLAPSSSGSCGGEQSELAEIRENLPYLPVPVQFNLDGVMSCADASVTDATCGCGYEVNPDSQAPRKLDYTSTVPFPGAFCECSESETNLDTILGYDKAGYAKIKNEKSLFSICNLTVGSFDHGTCCQAKTVTTECPTFQEKRKGCCREGRGRNAKAHHESAKIETISGGSLETAYAYCKGLCESDKGCSAFEFTKKKLKKKHRKKGKKQTYICEVHSAPIDSVTKKTKSCKRASCTMVEQDYE